MTCPSCGSQNSAEASFCRFCGTSLVVSRQPGVRVLMGRCHEAQGAPPYWPWIQIIRSYVRVCDTEQLRYQLGAGASDIAEMVPELKEHWPDLQPPPALEPQQARFRLFDSITRGYQ